MILSRLVVGEAEIPIVIYKGIIVRSSENHKDFEIGARIKSSPEPQITSDFLSGTV